jgi:Na+/H+-dicarboxylate symporter
MIVVPLVFASIFVGTASLGDLRKLGRIGAKTLVYYLVTTAVAITIGLVIANVAKPGEGLNPEVKAQLPNRTRGRRRRI